MSDVNPKSDIRNSKQILDSVVFGVGTLVPLKTKYFMSLQPLLQDCATESLIGGDKVKKDISGVRK